MPVHSNKNNQPAASKLKAGNYNKKKDTGVKEQDQSSTNDNTMEKVFENKENPINPLEYYHQQSLLFYLF